MRRTVCLYDGICKGGTRKEIPVMKLIKRFSLHNYCTVLCHDSSI